MTYLQRAVVMCAAIGVLVPGVLRISRPAAQTPTAVAFTNGRWFNGRSFDVHEAVYSVNGRLSFSKPERIDQQIDLDRGWVVPPFAEAHNHNIAIGAEEESDQQSIRRYVADGVLYVKIPGNVPPSPRTDRLAINRPNAIDVAFGHGSLTSTGGHPIALVNGLAARGLFRGHTPESLRDLRYFTIDSAADLERNWPRVASHRPDFIKVIFVWSEEHERAAGNDAAAVRVAGRTALKGLNSRLLPAVVAKVHASNLRVSAHVNTAADFHFAVSAGVDEIAHLPPRRAATIDENTALAIDDVREAARRGIVVVTTLALPMDLPGDTRATLCERQLANLRLLQQHGVPIAIGSDNPADSSLEEAVYVHGLGVLDNLTLLKAWTETTAKTIFPARQIGALRDGYEASFLALAGDPLTDFENVRRITLRVKQGHVIAP